MTDPVARPEIQETFRVLGMTHGSRPRGSRGPGPGGGRTAQWGCARRGHAAQWREDAAPEHHEVDGVDVTHERRRIRHAAEGIVTEVGRTGAGGGRLALLGEEVGSVYAVVEHEADISWLLAIAGFHTIGAVWSADQNAGARPRVVHLGGYTIGDPLMKGASERGARRSASASFRRRCRNVLDLCANVGVGRNRPQESPRNQGGSPAAALRGQPEDRWSSSSGPPRNEGPRRGPTLGVAAMTA